jgi:hypothetical protein
LGLLANEVIKRYQPELPIHGRPPLVWEFIVAPTP